MAQRCLSATPLSRTKNQPKKEVFGTDIPRTSGSRSRGGYPGSKLRSGPSKLWKNKHFGADMTRRRGRPRFQGVCKNFGQKNFGLNFRYLLCDPQISPKMFTWLPLVRSFPGPVGKEKKPINIKNFGGTPPVVCVCVCPVCRCPLDVPNLSMGCFRGIPTTKFLYVIFLCWFFSLHKEGPKNLF